MIGRRSGRTDPHMGKTEIDRTALLDEALRAFGEAWAAGDRAALASLLSPGYTHNDAFGARHDYGSWLEYAAGRKGRTTKIAFRDVRIRIIGDVAIVTGYNDMTGGGATAAGDKTDLTILFTQVWIWQNGRWLREAFQATPVRNASIS
jgi:ketosteroid isomerase-like protein